MHQPVMLKEAVSALNLSAGKVVLDGTVGGGGHAESILKNIAPGGLLIGMDADQETLKAAEDRLKGYAGSFKLVNDNFRHLDKVLPGQGVKGIDACLFDLGISSYQLDNAARGFGIKQDARLDMRMDQRLTVSAYDIVNRLPEKELSDIIEKFGEEHAHKRIARYIAEARREKPVETTYELADIVRRAAGFRKNSKGRRVDTATRTFQAIRIAVNDELAALEEGIKNAVSWLGPAGRICVISFHSLEDRIVKNLFRGYADLGILKILIKKPVRPAHEEVMQNPRSRSARLRAAERL